MGIRPARRNYGRSCDGASRKRAAGEQPEQCSAQITPTALTGAAGFSGYAMPIFMALAAWGALGKLEKWPGAGVQPSKNE